MPIREKDFEILRKAFELEDTLTGYKKDVGWEWYEIGAQTATLKKLVEDGYLLISYKSTKHTNYMLTDLGKAIVEGREDSLKQQEEYNTDLQNMTPQEMFPEIVGHDDIKELLLGVLCLDKPVHVLLVGPPSLSKSLFLQGIEDIGGPLAAWIAGSSTSKSGLQDLLVTMEPKWLLIDELEKMGHVDQSVLLSLMEGGRLIRTKVGRQLDEKIDIWVIATANTTYKLTPELLSRFAVKRLEKYNNEEFVAVVKSVLINREGLEEAEAELVASSLCNKTQDAREAIRIARLSRKLGIDKAIELLT